MRQPLQTEIILNVFEKIAKHSRGSGRIYITGGGSAVLLGWRNTTVDLDLKLLPEPLGVFEAIRDIKDSLHVNIELASPDDFIPQLSGWEERSLFIARFGTIDFFHYDFYSQALAKIERGHTRDLSDVDAMIERELVMREKLWRFFLEIEPKLIRFPAINVKIFKEKVAEVVGQISTI